MNQIIIALIFLFSVTSLGAKGTCDTKNPVNHFRKQLSKKSSKNIIFKKVKINNDKRKDFLIFDKDSCGFKGCDTYVYMSDGKRCYTKSNPLKAIIKKENKWYVSSSNELKALTIKNNKFEVSQ